MSSIPPRIIQTGKHRKLPLLAQAAVANLRCLNPDFDYVFFDDDAVNQFIASEFPKHRELFESFPYRIQRFDFFRYLAVYKLGGFYFDLDVFLAKGLGDLLAHSAVFPFEELTTNAYLRRELHTDWEIGNYAFAAAPGNRFLEAVIENCVRAQCDPDWVKPMLQHIPTWFRRDYEVLNTTGPGLLTRTLMENPELANHVTVLFPPDVCDESAWHQFGDYGVHAMEGSWRSGGILHRKLRNLWESRIAKRGLEESRKKGPRRTIGR
jgi:Mannosyltransferase OCH1 and related enzymes